MSRSPSRTCRRRCGCSRRIASTSAEAKSVREAPTRGVAHRPHRLAVADPDAGLDVGLHARAPARSPRRGRSSARARRWGPASSPKVSASRKSTSESVEPCRAAKRSGAIASARSRRRSGKSPTTPLCTKSQRPWRKGWQFVSCTAVPGRRAHVGEDERRRDVRGQRAQVRVPPGRATTLWNTPGSTPVPYHPTPKPSPFVVSAPIRECRLWSTSPCSGLNSRSSSSTGCPDHAIQRHTARRPSVAEAGLDAAGGRARAGRP